MVKLLLEGGADVNLIGRSYHTALQAPAFASYNKAVEILLDAGAEINTTGGGFQSALFAVAFSA
jgi:ankyrin repeat protein